MDRIMFWNIKLTIKEQGEKNIDIGDDKNLNLEFIIDKLIKKYHGTINFFDTAIHKSGSSVFVTDNITVTIMNGHLGYVNFEHNGWSSVQTIKVQKRELFSLYTIL